MADARRRPEMTVEEFLEWNLSQDERYELVDGMPVPLRAMAGAKAEHDPIVVNLIAELRQQLRGSDCRPRTADTAVCTSIRRVRRPDVTIECAALELGALEARRPIAAFEVLSRTTRQLDRSVKLHEYMHHPSLKVVVHIDPAEMDVLVYTRGESGDWDAVRLETSDMMIRVPGTPVAVALDALYDGVPVTRMPRDPQPT